MYFTITTIEPDFFIACVEKACYGISQRTITSQLPVQLANAREGDKAFLRLTQTLVCGPLIVTSPPDGITWLDRLGNWCKVDSKSSRQDLLPLWVEIYPWCLFFDTSLVAQVNYFQANWLKRHNISLPPWGSIPDEIGEKLWKLISEDGRDFSDFIQRIKPTVKLSGPRTTKVDVIPATYRTKNGILVRSKSECLIANWLFDRNIRFEYERSVALDGYQLRPDFYLPADDLYIEHLGLLHTNGSYSDDWKWKLALYRKHGIRLVVLEEPDIQRLEFQMVAKLKHYLPNL